MNASRTLSLAVVIISLNAALLGACNLSPSSERAKAEETNSRELSFEEKREDVVVFLNQLFELENDFQDSSAPILASVHSNNDLLEVNRAFANLSQLLDGYLQRLTDLQAPQHTPELAMLRLSVEGKTSIFLSLIEDIRHAISIGSESELNRALGELQEYSIDSDTRREEIIQGLLARFNIPDSEVEYRREFLSVPPSIEFNDPRERLLAELRKARGSIELKGPVIVNGVTDTELEDGDDVWASVNSVSVSIDTTDKKEGTASVEISIPAGFSTGLAAFENISRPLDLSGHDSIGLWVKSTTATGVGALSLIIDDSSGCDSPSQTFQLPSLAAGTWKRVVVDIADNIARTSIACVGLHIGSDNGSQIVNLDNIVARGQATDVFITIANARESEFVDLTTPRDSDSDGIADTDNSNHKLIISYMDVDQVKKDLAWSKSFVGVNDGDDLLEDGELAELTISLVALEQALPLVRNTEFNLELKPGESSALIIERKMPERIDTVMNLQ